MDRRTLLQHVFAFLGIPAGAAVDTSFVAIRATLPSNPAVGGDVATAPLPGGPLFPLEEWLRLPMTPLHRPEDLGDRPDPHTCLLAATILARLSAGTPFVFRYRGGSEPGSVRRVLPVLLFRKFDPAAEEPAAETTADPVYLLAHCQARQAPRTFRLDRIEPVQPDVILN